MSHSHKDIIEQIVEQCASDFDVEFNPAPSWTVISDQLDQRAAAQKPTKRSAKILPLWLRTAGIAAALMIGLFTGRYIMPAPSTIDSSQMAEIKTHYKQEVDRQITLVKAYDPDHAILDEIQSLDEQIEILEQDYLNANDFQRELILESMISNYQARVDLLQNIISKLNNHSHEKFTEI